MRCTRCRQDCLVPRRVVRHKRTGFGYYPVVSYLCPDCAPAPAGITSFPTEPLPSVAEGAGAFSPCAPAAAPVVASAAPRSSEGGR